MTSPGGDRPRALSFRDPDGQVFSVGNRIIRSILPAAAADVTRFLSTPTAAELCARGDVIGSRIVPQPEREELNRCLRLSDDPGGLPMYVEHDRVPFVTFPQEWPPEMLHRAATLTLDLAERVLEDGFGLKDATPYNILFRGPRAVFIDVLSFERRDPRDATWLPYGQFVRTFLLPLLAARHFGLPLAHVFTRTPDGLTPLEVYRMSGAVRRLLPPFLTLASIPTWLETRDATPRMTVYQRPASRDPDEARFIVKRLFRSLRRSLERARPTPTASSPWSRYDAPASYPAGQFAAKERFIDRALDDVHPSRVLDVGCNTGHFSVAAARKGASIVAIDFDSTVVGAVWRTAIEHKLDILPLVVDFAQPTPATGWRNRDHPSFLQRTDQAFDLVLMLAVVHHLVVNARIPLAEIFDLAAHLTRGFLLAEFVGPGDAMFKCLARGRDHLFGSISEEAFVAAAQSSFEVVRSERVPDSDRALYLFRRR